MRTSIAEAKAATASLLQKVQPHMEETQALMTLGDFLPVALQALETIESFEAEVPEVLQRYTSTCNKLRETIQETEDAGGQRAWKDVTIEGKSWTAHRITMQSYIQILQVQAIKKKVKTPLPKYDEPPPYDA